MTILEFKIFLEIGLYQKIIIIEKQKERKKNECTNNITDICEENTMKAL